jgi:hypothetical protein
MWERMKLTQKNWSSVLLFGVLTGSLVLNLALAMKYRALVAPGAPAGVKLGITLGTIHTLDLKGAKGEIHVGDGHPTVLYIMAPSCGWCARNLENIRTLTSTRASDYRFIGLSVTSADLREYLASTPLPFPVYALDMDRLPPGLDAKATPQMALVGSDGRVEKAWIGALEGKRKLEVEGEFHVTLPGLVAPAVKGL